MITAEKLLLTSRIKETKRKIAADNVLSLSKNIANVSLVIINICSLHTPSFWVDLPRTVCGSVCLSVEKITPFVKTPWKEGWAFMTGLRYSPLHVTEFCGEMQGKFKVGLARLMNPLFWRKNPVSPRLLRYATVTPASHHCKKKLTELLQSGMSLPL